MHRVLFVLALCVCIVCGAGAAEPDPSSPEAFVRSLYAARDREEGPFFPHDDRSELDRWLIPALADLVWEDAAAAGDEVGTIDGDPLVDAQDWEIAAFEVHPAKMSDDTNAEVEVTFTNFGEPRKIVYHLQHDAGRWRIANIAYADWSLYRVLRDAADERAKTD